MDYFDVIIKTLKEGLPLTSFQKEFMDVQLVLFKNSENYDPSEKCQEALSYYLDKETISDLDPRCLSKLRWLAQGTDYEKELLEKLIKYCAIPRDYLEKDFNKIESFFIELFNLKYKDSNLINHLYNIIPLDLEADRSKLADLEEISILVVSSMLKQYGIDTKVEFSFTGDTYENAIMSYSDYDKKKCLYVQI